MPRRPISLSVAGRAIDTRTLFIFHFGVSPNMLLYYRHVRYICTLCKRLDRSVVDFPLEPHTSHG